MRRLMGCTGSGIKVTMVRAEHFSEVVHTDLAMKAKTVHLGGEPACRVIDWVNACKL